jgi:hypothetical protein
MKDKVESETDPDVIEGNWLFDLHIIIRVLPLVGHPNKVICEMCATTSTQKYLATHRKTPIKQTATYLLFVAFLNASNSFIPSSTAVSLDSSVPTTAGFPPSPPSMSSPSMSTDASPATELADSETFTGDPSLRRLALRDSDPSMMFAVSTPGARFRLESWFGDSDMWRRRELREKVGITRGLDTGKRKLK